jgi:hypothetical protein
MMLLALVSWWYTTGWARLVARIGHRIESVLESFSVGLLIRTLFDPFRQISAGAAQGKSLDAQMRALGDRLFSRIFGAFVRTLFIVIGLVLAILAGVVGIFQLLFWPLLPLLPLIGIILAVMGWVPNGIL